MHFTTDQEDATTIFRLKEPRLDSRNAGQLKAEFLILAQPDIDTLIVDLTDVRHVDSAGLSALLLAQRQMRIHSGEVRLVGVNEDVRSLLAVTQLDRIFPIFGTVDDALDAEPSLEGEDDDDIELTSEEAKRADERFSGNGTVNGKGTASANGLGPEAPTASSIRAGAIAAGGSLGAAALAEIMMTTYDEDSMTFQREEEEESVATLAFGDDEDFDDDDDDVDDLDEDFEEDEEFSDEADDDDDDDDADEEDDAEEDEAAEEGPDEDLVEDDDFEDDDWDDEELEEDEEEDY